MPADGSGRAPLDWRRQSFVVRIWEERRDIADAERTWRGSVDVVHTGARAYFASLDELTDYLRQHTGMSVASAQRPRV
jgi:hypothetical protein